ncbi:MAG: response regulator [Puniceicoccaceae bacterium]
MSILMFSCVISSGLVAVAFLTYELVNVRSSMVKRLLTDARVISVNIREPMLSGNKAAADEILATLSTDRSIVAAFLFDSEGAVFATFQRDTENPMAAPDPDAKKQGFSLGQLRISEPIQQANQQLGTIFIAQDLNKLKMWVFPYVGILSWGLLISILVAVILSNLLGRVFLRPILELAATTRRITRKHNYSTRAKSFYNDEVGQLIDSFNEMLSVVENKEHDLRDREQRFRALIENASDLIIILNSEGQIIYGSPSLSRLFNNDAKEYIGQSFFEFMHPSDVWRCKQTFQRLKKRSNTLLGFEFQFKGRDGSWMDIGAIARNLLHVSGVNGIVVNGRDVTSRKELTKELITHRDDLEQMVAARTQDLEASRKAALDSMEDANLQRLRAEDALAELTLSQESLARAKDAAEEASKAKSNFIANMSHEIRTPMNAVIGLADLALKSDSKKKQTDYLEKILRASRILLGIINDILDFSKIEQRKVELEATTFDLHEEMRTINEMFARNIEDKGLSLRVDFAQDIPANVVGDPLRLRQILINLFSNAIKFTEKGEISLSARMVKHEEGQITLEFSVSDTGIGMDEELTAKVFESFKQGDESTTRVFGGTGLGLAISKHLVELMGGTISAKSFYGKGSTFTFTVVFEEAVMESIPEAPTGLEGLRILVVDEEKEVQEMLSHLLKDFSFRTATAGSVDEAVKMLGAAPFGDPFRLVILDWNMPEKKGTEAVKIITELNTIPLKPSYMIMSGYWNEELHKDLDECGVTAFLPKPFKSSTLLDLIIRQFSDEVMDVVRAVKDSDASGIPDLSHANLLLAEDNELNQEVALGLLEETQCKVFVVENGKAALEAITEDTYDLVLMDIQMPELDGYETTRQLRDMESRGELPKRDNGDANDGRIPIIAMTAGTLSRDKDRAFEAGMDDHVSKPVDPKLFYKVLAKWLGGVAAEGSSVGKKRVLSPKDETKSDQSEGILTSLAPFPGIELEKGLMHVGGNEERLGKLMLKFRKGQANVVEEIKTALADGDRELAHRTAHTLKGLAGTLGATTLQEAARVLEAALKGEPGKKDEDALLVDVEQSLQEVIEGLAPLETVPSSGAKKKRSVKISKKERTRLLNKLSSLLEDGDSEAIACYNELNEAGVFSTGSGQPDQLGSLIEAYSFEEAKAVLKTIMESPEDDKEAVKDD